MKPKILLPLLAAFFVVAVVGVLKFGLQKSPEVAAPSPQAIAPVAVAPKKNCGNLVSEEFEMKDSFMHGVIEAGQKAKVIKEYYTCNKPERGDVVLKSRGDVLPPIARFMRAVPGDHFKLVQDTKKKQWNIEINGKLLMSEGVAEATPYFFGSENPPALYLYEKPRNGILGPGEIIIFSSVPPGEQDSGQFGIMSLGDIIGKVELK